MAIFHIEGDNADLVANSLRNAQISAAKGALLVTADGDPRHQVEKIIAADALTPGTPAANVNWKPESAVICVGALVEKLDEFEALVPGFMEYFGPVSRIAA